MGYLERNEPPGPRHHEPLPLGRLRAVQRGPQPAASAAHSPEGVSDKGFRTPAKATDEDLDRMRQGGGEETASVRTTCADEQRTGPALRQAVCAARPTERRRQRGAAGLARRPSAPSSPPRAAAAATAADHGPTRRRRAPPGRAGPRRELAQRQRQGWPWDLQAAAYGLAAAWAGCWRTRSSGLSTLRSGSSTSGSPASSRASSQSGFQAQTNHTPRPFSWGLNPVAPVPAELPGKLPQLRTPEPLPPPSYDQLAQDIEAA